MYEADKSSARALALAESGNVTLIRFLEREPGSVLNNAPGQPRVHE